MNKQLVTLEEHNKMAIRHYNRDKHHYNGIACPKCGEELIDSDPEVILSSMPLQKNIACLMEICGYVGYRIV